MTARSEQGLRPERVAEVIVGPVDGGRARRGSGYLVASGTVLTAAHVVARADGIRVRFQAGRPGEREVDATVAWTDDGIDVAVLTLSGHSDDDVPSAVFGTVGEQDAVLTCTAMGFPRFKLRRNAEGRPFRDAEHMDARCAVLANRREGTLDLRITAPPAEDPDPERDAWEGMSGAAVFSGGYLVGVVTRHHRREGTGRIAAGRVDRWRDVLSAGERAELGALLSYDGTALPEVSSWDSLDLVQEVYRAQLADIAPELLDEREAELADLVSFCGGSEPYRWLQGRPWAGKTALAAWFALHPPRGVVPVCFFITARYAGQSDGDAYTAAVVDQLATIVGREPVATASPAARDGERRLLLRQAAERVARDGGTLLLVVDGLDEDQSRMPGGTGVSIASLLPERLPPNVRVLVTSRPNPGIPPDVGGGHPLRHCPVVRLTTSEAARHTEHEAKYDLQRALAGDRLERDVVGLLTAARGTLTVEDLRQLTGEPSYTLRQRLGSVFGRILRLRGSGIDSADGDVTMYTTNRGYLFAHETLLAAAQDELGPDVEAYRSRLHTWAQEYERRGWPEETPLYLLQPYSRLVALLQDARRIAALAVDARRRDRLREATGSDAACLAEIAAARETVLRVAPDDLGALGALAAVADLVARRNESLHPDIPAVHARLGRVRQAIGLARSVFKPEDRSRALLAVARELAEAGDRRAVGLAEEGMRLVEEALRPNSSVPWAAHGTWATVLALVGRGEEAVSVLRELPRPEDGPHLKEFIDALVMTATALGHTVDAADLLRLAEETAGRIEFLSWRVRVLVSIAEAWSACGFSEHAARLRQAVIEFARSPTNDCGNLPAVAADALRETHPREAEQLVSPAVAELGRDLRGPWEWERFGIVGALVTFGVGWMRGPVFGDVCALVITDRMAEAQRLMEERPRSGRADDDRFLQSFVAEGWARRGAVTEAWAVLLSFRTRIRSFFGDVYDTPRRVVELLARAGAADELEALVLAEASSSSTLSTEWQDAAEVLATLAGHFVVDDPQRALELLHKAEHGHQPTAGPVPETVQEHLAALAGALATVGRPDEAERLMATINERDATAWASAVVSLAVAESDPARALCLAERAVESAFTVDRFVPLGAKAAAVQALGRAGAADAVERVLEEQPSLWKVYDPFPPPSNAHDPFLARVEAASALWSQDPEAAGRLVDDALLSMRGDDVPLYAQLLVTVGHHDDERSAHIRRLLDATDHQDPVRQHTIDVLRGLLTAVTAPAAARRNLDAMAAQAEGEPWPDAGSRGGAALAYAVLGDDETARTLARGGGWAEQCAEVFAHLAAYAALLPGDRVPVPLHLENYYGALLARRLGTLLLPPPSGPDLPRARAFLAEALTPDGWHHAVPVLAAIDPDAVLRVRDAVYAHLGLND
ncbi:trypsin-like peptidase domain-containing protein [Streptomyces fulvoviolaceus]|uniref:trypsin-like peptidase domain-containing protein n=1 Tax=Streptomyces fulvoviolaceus TaxID=285535 RepID=UPI00131AE4DD|nr:trypsin-like peptidase domain-containing protein [Streptomyces fulvoviolaceus]